MNLQEKDIVTIDWDAFYPNSENIPFKKEGKILNVVDIKGEKCSKVEISHGTMIIEHKYLKKK